MYLLNMDKYLIFDRVLYRQKTYITNVTQYEIYGLAGWMIKTFYPITQKISTYYLYYNFFKIKKLIQLPHYFYVF